MGMRNNGQNPYSMLFPNGPLIDGPITRVSEKCMTWQMTQCAEFERRFWSCMEAVGSKRAQYYCFKEIDDFNECQKRTKEHRRYVKMQQVRKEKGLPYEKSPTAFSFKEST